MRSKLPLRPTLPVLLLLAVPALVVSACLLFGMGPVLGPFNAHFYFNNDNFNFVLPKLAILKHSLDLGQFPLWNALEGAGQPLFATGSKPVFSLPLLHLLPGLDFMILIGQIHAAVAMLVFYSLARELGISGRGSALGALAWALSGYHALYLHDITLLGTNMWMPLALLAWLRYARGGSALLWLAVGAAAVCLQEVGGRPPDFMYNMIFLSLFIANDRIQGASGPAAALRRLVRPAAAIALAVGLGLLLSAAHLFPFIEFLTTSQRFEEVYHLAPTRYLGWRSLLGLISVQPFPGTDLFIGMATIPLVAASWRLRRQPRHRFLFWTMAVATALVLPLGLFDLVRLLPMLAGIDTSFRAIPFLNFSAAMLAGMGFDDLFPEAGPAGKRPGADRILLYLPLALFGSQVIAFGAMQWRAPSPLHLAQVLAAALTLGACLASRRWAAAGRPGPAFLALFPALFIALFLGNQVMPKGDPSAGLGRLDPAAIPESFRFVAEQSRSDLFRAYPLPSAREMAFTLPGLGVQQPTVYEAAPPIPAKNMILRMRNGSPFPGIFDVNNVRYLLGRAGDIPGWAMERYPVRMQGKDGSIVLENPGVLPRAYLSSDYRVAADAGEQLDLVSRPRDTGAVPPVALAAPPGFPASGLDAGRAGIVRYSPNVVDVQASALHPCLLVLLDTFAPGWTASVDGEPAPILRANYAFRAVRVPAGEHRVTFRYDPPSFRLGLRVSAATAAVLLLLAGLGLRRSGRTAGRP